MDTDVRKLLVICLTLLLKLLDTGAFVTGQFQLPPQRSTGLGCITEGEVVSYTCTVSDPDGNGATRWRGSGILMFCSQPLFLSHGSYGLPSGTSESCGDGRYSTQSTGVSGSNYISVLTFNATRDVHGLEITCDAVGGATVGSDTVQVGVEPSPPVNPVCSFPVPGETFTVSWSPPPGGVVGGAEYSVTTTGDCGSCTTSGLMTSCSGWTASGQTCTLTSQTITTDCGLASEMSETETVVLRVPTQPSVTWTPIYAISGPLLSIQTEISESQFTNQGEVCPGVPADVTHFLLEYTSGDTSVSRQLPAGCDGGVCVDVFNVSGDCPGDTYNVSAHAVNIVGPGPANIMSFECIADCDRLDPPTSGSVTFTRGGDEDEGSLPAGAMAAYSCNPWYELVGDETRLCQNDGQWSGETPHCNCNTPLPQEEVNNGLRVSVDCVSAEYSVQTGYCPSTFTATFNFTRGTWYYPSTSVCIGTSTAVGITFVLTFVFSLALGIIIGVISVLLWNKFRRKQPSDGNIELKDTPASAVAIYEEPEVMKKEPEDIETSGNVAYGPVHTRR